MAKDLNGLRGYETVDNITIVSYADDANLLPKMKTLLNAFATNLLSLINN